MTKPKSDETVNFQREDQSTMILFVFFGPAALYIVSGSYLL